MVARTAAIRMSFIRAIPPTVAAPEAATVGHRVRQNRPRMPTNTVRPGLYSLKVAFGNWK